MRPLEPTEKRDQLILQYLLRQPAASLKEIADYLRIPETTATKRIWVLRSKGWLSRELRVSDWEAAGLKLRFRIDLMIDHRSLVGGKIRRVYTLQHLGRYIVEESRNRYPKDLFVYDALIPFGQAHDLSILLRAQDHDIVLEYVSLWLGTLVVVTATTTYQEAWSYSDAQQPRNGKRIVDSIGEINENMID